MGFVKEFKEFALKGNVMDMAVGVIIGGAFQAIVSSLVDDIISPIIGCVGGKDLSAYAIPWLWGDATIRIGAFVTAIINFLIMALVLFLMIKAINKVTSLGAKKEEVAPDTKECPFCKSTISINATKCPHCTSDLQ
ncbi:MAG: large conductance mechanosensitive channel protein MscL [Lachnospiraceae bacterium]|nr:large conductance mechanosensitive channel protein MscL [Lachnospiraceae bacterium]